MKSPNSKLSNVTVLIEVYNEESRIESCLKSFGWADEIILFDKHSTDNTRALAQPYVTEIVLVPYNDGSNNYINNIENRDTKEWCLFPTASSLMHPDLAEKIIQLTTQSDFPYDIIGMPFAMLSFGIHNKRSPFFVPHKHTLIKRNTLKLSTRLHNEISSRSTRIFNIPTENPSAVLYHCTHANASLFWEHVVRYAKYESENDSQLTVKKAGYDILKSLYHIIFRRKSYLIGKDGMALSLGYLAYFITRFLFIWDKARNPQQRDIYKGTRDLITKLWEERERKKNE